MVSRTTRILLVVGTIAVAAWLWMGRSSHRAPTLPDRLAVFDPARVDGIVLERESNTLRFARADSAWRITAPISDAAEPSAVISLLDVLERSDIARDLGAAGDLAPFGLDPPRLRITLLAGADTLLDATIGNRTVDDAWTYARAAPRDLVLVPTGIARAASLPLAAYRNQRVVDFQLRDVARYALTTPDHATAWARHGDGWRTVEHGDTIPGDSVAVETVLRRLRGLRVASFVEAADTSIGAGDATLTLVGNDGFRFATVRLAKRGSAWVAAVDRDERTVVVIDDIADLVAHTTTELRERRLLQFSPPQAQRIRLAVPSVSGELVRAGGMWSFPNPALGRVDPDRAADLVRALRSLKWDAPRVQGRPGNPGFGVLISDAGGGILDEVTFAPSTTDTMWVAQSRSDGNARAISRARIDQLGALFRGLRSTSTPR